MNTLLRVSAFVLITNNFVLAQSIMVSSGGGSVVQSSEADDHIVTLNKMVYKQTTQDPKPAQAPQPIAIRPTAIQPQPVVTKPQPRLFSTEQSAAEHLREVHGIEASGKSLLEMEMIHDRAHGGSQFHFPGMPSLNTSQPVRYQANNCPNGRCPTVRTTQLTYSRRTTRRR
jgi:hypothetical protein